ncbi:MAG: ABC transporter permease [Hyphomicrobium sp.]
MTVRDLSSRPDIRVMRNSLLLDKRWVDFSLHFLRQDIARQYERTGLGIFWLMIAQTITISGIAFVYSMVFNVSLKEFFPYLAISILTWNLVSGAIGEAPRTYHVAGSILNAFPLPYSTFALRMTLRHFVIFLFGLPVYFAIAVYCGVTFFHTLVVGLVNLALLFTLLYPLSNLLGILGARFRDLAPAMAAAIYLLFLLSPILYEPSRLPPRGQWLIHVNPFYYLLELVRRPFLGQLPGPEIYAAALFMIAVAWMLSSYFNKKYGSYLVFWV